MSDPPPNPPHPVPQILWGYRLYRITMLFVYAGFVTIGGWAFVTQVGASQGGPVMGLFIAVIGILFGCGIGASWRFPHEPWAWNAHLVLICLGVPLVITTPFAMLMGYAWLHPEVKNYFGVAPPESWL